MCTQGGLQIVISHIKNILKKQKKIETKDQEGQAQFIMKSISNKYIFIVLWHYLFLKE